MFYQSISLPKVQDMSVCKKGQHIFSYGALQHAISTHDMKHIVGDQAELQSMSFYMRQALFHKTTGASSTVLISPPVVSKC